MSPDPAPVVVRVFLGIDGLRSGWRLLLFLLLWGGLAVGLALLSHRWALRVVGQELPVMAIAAFAATWIAARLEGRPFTAYGLGPPHRVRNLLAGLAAGFVGLSLLVGTLTAVGAFHPSGPDLHGWPIARWALYWTAAFTFTAFNEEMVMRGYALFALSRGIGFWPAAAALSLLFGGAHIGNNGEETIGIANAVLAGMMFAYSLRWTGTLWWAIGCHLSWDWAETFFYGVPNSGGGVSAHHFLTGTPAGPGWLSGGTVGPEGSVLAAVVLALLAISVRYTAPRHEAPGLGRHRTVKEPEPVTAEQTPLPNLPA